VRVGNAGQAIAAEAAAAQAQMILLPTFGPPWWKRAFGLKLRLWSDDAPK